MEEIKAWIERHPYLSSALAVGIVVLIYLLSSGGGDASTASAGGISQADLSLSEAQLASGTQLQGQANQLAAQQNELNAGLSASAIQYASQDTANKLAAQTADQNIGGQVSIAQIQGNTQVSLAGIQGQVLQEQYQQQTAQQKIVADTQYASNLLNAQTVQQGQAYQYATSFAQVQAQEQEQNNELAINTINAQLAAQTNSALIALLGSKN